VHAVSKKRLRRVGPGARRCVGKESELGPNAKKFATLLSHAHAHATASMSLYYEAATVLANTENTGGSLKSRIYGKKDLKSTPGQLFALIAETSKWSIVLKDVIEKTKLLAEERKVGSLLAILCVAS